MSVTITSLSPDTGYLFTIAPVKGEMNGPLSHVEVRTPGRCLPQPRITNAAVSPKGGNVIKLTWNLIQKKKEDYEFAIYYSLKERDMNIVRNVTRDMTFTVMGLQSCKSHTFAVSIISTKTTTNGGPYGLYGPPSAFYPKATKYSPASPLKNLQAKLEGPTNILVTWEASCPTIDDGIGYIILFKDRVKGTNKTIGIRNTKRVSDEETRAVTGSSFSQTFSENVWYGATYRFYVRTEAEGSTYAGPVSVSTAPISSPLALASRINSTNFIFTWTSLKDLPDYIVNEGKTFSIVVSRTPDMSDVAKTYNVQTTSIQVPTSDLDTGRVYYMAAKIIDHQGYESGMTPPVAIEAPIPDGDIVVKTSNLAAILVAVVCCR